MISLSSIVKAKNHYIYSSGCNVSTVEEKMHEAPVSVIDSEREKILQDAIIKARLIKEQANKEAELILEAAQKLQDSIKFQAEQNGYQDGYSKGLKQGAMEVRSNAEESLKEMEKLLKVINYERLEAVKRHETDILQISFEVAKKIMRQHILSDSEAILQMIEEIYHKYEYEHETNVKITIPEYSKVIDVEIDKNIAKRISEQIENSKVIISKNDDFIMIESDNSAVDASFDLQINQLKEEVIL